MHKTYTLTLTAKERELLIKALTAHLDTMLRDHCTIADLKNWCSRIEELEQIAGMP